MSDSSTLSKMNREIGETLTMVGSIKEMLDDHKAIHHDIKELLELHDERIASIEESRTWARAVVWVVGVVSGAVGSLAALAVKAFANH